MPYAGLLMIVGDLDYRMPLPESYCNGFEV